MTIRRRDIKMSLCLSADINHTGQMTMNLQAIFVSSLNSEKTSGCKRNERKKTNETNERKKLMFKIISMAGACRRLFKPCHQALLKAK